MSRRIQLSQDTTRRLHALRLNDGEAMEEVIARCLDAVAQERKKK